MVCPPDFAERTGFSAYDENGGSKTVNPDFSPEILSEFFAPTPAGSPFPGNKADGTDFAALFEVN